MSYEKQTWQSGDIITAAKMNHIEDGISSGVSGGLLVELQSFPSTTMSGSSLLKNVTAQDIVSAFESGIIPLLYVPSVNHYLPMTFVKGSSYAQAVSIYPEATPSGVSGVNIRQYIVYTSGVNAGKALYNHYTVALKS